MKYKKYILYSVLAAIGLAFPGTLFSQECGPCCPICSGGSIGKSMNKGGFLLYGIFIPGGEEEKGVFKLSYGIFSWLDAGIGYTIEAEKFTWSLRVQVISEEKEGWRPGLLVGTGSVQAMGSDQSLYLQLVKSWEFGKGFALQITGGMATLLSNTDRLYGLAGLTLTITEKFSTFVNYDGRNIHPGISWIAMDWLTLSALLIKGREFAFSTGIRWKLK